MAKHLFHKRWLFRLGALLALALFGVLTGCTPAIGDECGSRGDCPADAICDNTVADGYCTIPNCRVGECPEDSLCVIFDRNTRFCMEACEVDADCRADFACRRDNNLEDAPLGYCYMPADAPSATEP